jgi:hypothetical protein
MLLSELGTESGAHKLVFNVGWGTEVGLSALSS